MRTFFTMLGADCAAKVSLAMQFIASFCWAVGAVLAGPMNVADFLQLSAAVAWCIANFAFRFCVQPGSWNTALVTNMVTKFLLLMRSTKTFPRGRERRQRRRELVCFPAQLLSKRNTRAAPPVRRVRAIRLKVLGLPQHHPQLL